jgi:hypothetical protein
MLMRKDRPHIIGLFGKLIMVLVCLFFQSFTLTLFAQKVDYIVGKILISGTSNPIPFSTIRLKNKQLGLFANGDGDFKIINNPDFQADSVIVTCIGYKRSSIAFKRLSDTTVNKIFLTQAIYSLGEVKISTPKRELSSPEIIGKAIRNIKNNYPGRPFSLIGYYREYQKKGSNYINLNEAIIQTLDKGFASKSLYNHYRLLDFRKNAEFQRIDISPYYDTIGTLKLKNHYKIIPKAKLGDQFGNEFFVLMVHDPIRNFNTRSFSFIDVFSDNFLFNHIFSSPVKVLNNNLPLYKISFTGKSRITGDSITVSGAIYIQPNDFSIHKLEYSCSFLTYGNRKKELFNVEIEYGYEKSVNSLMYLKYISFNNIFNVVNPADTNYFKVTDSYWDPNSNSTIVFNFNNQVSPRSAQKRDNYDIKVGGKKSKISTILVKNKMVFVRLADENIAGYKDSTYANIIDLEDINGNIINKRKTLELYQYREMFVQQYNRKLPFLDSCYLQYSPLEQNCISKYSGNYDYWMNTPENIKIQK